MATFDYGIMTVDGTNGQVIFSMVAEFPMGETMMENMSAAGAAGWELVYILPLNDQLASVRDNYVVFWKKTLS